MEQSKASLQMNKKNRKMKRYAIVYADGSNRRLTQIDYPSRKDTWNKVLRIR